jgi:hypothetical protein
LIAYSRRKGQTFAVNSSFDLFETPPLLEWLPDETFFSLASRHHRLWGHSVAHRTAEQLFGHFQGGAHHDFPSYLGEYVARTGGVHGSVETLAQHTLLKYYSAFMQPVDVSNAVAVMSSNNVAHLKLKLGILTSRFRANHPLKACETCMVEDSDAEGWAYWHLEHQYPGVWICLKHSQLLKESIFKSSGVERFQWHLPSTECLHPGPVDVQNQSNLGRVALTDFSHLVANLVNQAALDPIDTLRLHEVYRTNLIRRGWVTAGGSLRMPLIAASYLEHVSPLRAVPELSALPNTADDAAVQLGCILRAPRSGTHPLRHLSLISWLFGTPDAFWSAYQAMQRRVDASVDGSPDSELVATVQVENADPRVEMLVKLLSEPGMSARAASRAVGIDVATAMAWAAQAGIKTDRRPKTLKTELRKTIIAELSRGADKLAAAELAGVSIGTITRLLLTEVGLHATWVKVRQDEARMTARREWTTVLEANATAGTKFLRALVPRAYAWLYRNDRAWLDSQKPTPLLAAAVSGAHRVAWDARDEVLSAQVRHAAIDIQLSNGPKRLKLWQIYQAVPELKAKLGSLSRLPLTREAIDNALRHVPGTRISNLFA